LILFALRIPDHYAECYPGMTEMDDAIDDSDEEADYSKMDLVSFKVDFFKKGSLDSMPSPSPFVKIQIMGGKVCFKVLGKTLLGVVNKLFVFKSLLTRPGNVLTLHLKQTFPSII
jgi:hypothetical protein